MIRCKEFHDPSPRTASGWHSTTVTRSGRRRLKATPSIRVLEQPHGSLTRLPRYRKRNFRRMGAGWRMYPLNRGPPTCSCGLSQVRAGRGRFRLEAGVFQSGRITGAICFSSAPTNAFELWATPPAAIPSLTAHRACGRRSDWRAWASIASTILSPDGKRFAVVLEPEQADPSQPITRATVLLNFFDELRRRVPAPGQ